MAAVLLEEFPEGKRAVAYASRTLTAQEMKYSNYELEALAVLYGVEKFRMYLEHSEFLLQADNQALSWVLVRPRKSGSLARWSFNFRVEHIPSYQNIISDSLSRMFEGYLDNTGWVELPRRNYSPGLDPSSVRCRLLMNVLRRPRPGIWS